MKSFRNTSFAEKTNLFTALIYNSWSMWVYALADQHYLSAGWLRDKLEKKPSGDNIIFVTFAGDAICLFL